MNSMSPKYYSNSPVKRKLTYNSVWRWHFYAGLFCIPFALWLSVTGGLYLFKPQIEAWIDRDYDNLVIIGQTASPKDQVLAALATVPDSVLNAYELPTSNTSAVRILVGKEKQLHRVYVHPQTLEILNSVPEDERLMPLIFHLHGDLLAGDKGSMLVELAASWMVVLIITGLYLWWPRNTAGLAGIVYPRLTSGGRTFWRDIHSVTGLWVAFFVLFLIVSGLPWAKSWGGMLKQVRQSVKTMETTPVKQDWTTGPSSELAERQANNTPTPVAAKSGGGEHDGHNMSNSIMMADYSLLNHITEVVSTQQLAAPVMITPPTQSNPNWSARSDTQNRPLRANLKLDATTGEIIERKDFSQRPLLDRIIGTGVAAHEGQLFGWFNQALGLLTAIGVFLLGISSVVLWWSRRTPGTLGAPKALKHPPLPFFLGIVILVLGAFLPLLGISLVAILCIEYTILCRLTWTRDFLSIKR
jgi:uncharacterized iron-regulated membrane protein